MQFNSGMVGNDWFFSTTAQVKYVDTALENQSARESSPNWASLLLVEK